MVAHCCVPCSFLSATIALVYHDQTGKDRGGVSFQREAHDPGLVRSVDNEGIYVGYEAL